MILKLSNSSSTEELSERTTALYDAIVSSIDGVAIGDAAEALGVTIGYLCLDLEYKTQGLANRDNILGAIYQNASKVLKLNINLKDYDYEQEEN